MRRDIFVVTVTTELASNNVALRTVILDSNTMSAEFRCRKVRFSKLVDKTTVEIGTL